jgi:hypothetical protein
LRAKIEKEAIDKFKESSYKLKPKLSSNKSITVKSTVAAIFREEALHSKNRKLEQESLAMLEIGLKDEKEFEKWRNTVKSHEEAERLARMEEKRLQIQILHQDTFFAKQEYFKQKRFILV